MSVSSGRRAPSQIRDRIVGLRRIRADELLPNPKNWRQHPKAQADALKGLLGEIGYADALLARETPDGLMLIDGHLRAETTPKTKVPVLVLDLDEAEADKLLLTLDPLAAMAEMDGEATKALLEGVESESEAVQALLGGLRDQATVPVPQDSRPSLADRFVVPPFSVLDARQGYWQERKRQWLALGIQSELGRGEGGVPSGSLRPAASVGPDGQTVRGDGRGRAYHAQSGTNRDDLLGHSRKAADYRSNVTGAPSRPDWAVGTGTENMSTGTSIFDPVLCELAYRWFSPPEGAVIDPFAGGSVRGIAASVLGRRYTGIDLSAAQIAANEEQAAVITPDSQPTWIEGDGRDVLTLAPGEYDLFFSCPPYGNLEVYSDDPRDLSTMKHDDFLAAYRDIVAASLSLLREDRFACFVVGDFRDRRGLYRNFVSDTIAAFEDAGAHLYNEAILVQAVGSLPLRVGKQFIAGRKLGKTHQNVLVFVKGDPKKATVACGNVEATWLDP